MKTIKVQTEQWFSKAAFNEVKMLAIKHLAVPAHVMEDSHKEENFKRSLARQMFMRTHEFGESFEIIEPSNPFGKVPKRRSSTTAGNGLTGEYRFVKRGIRSPDGDIRHHMADMMEKHTNLEELLKEWESTVGLKTSFKSTGSKHHFTFIDQVKWALTHDWIVRV